MNLCLKNLSNFSECFCFPKNLWCITSRILDIKLLFSYFSSSILSRILYLWWLWCSPPPGQPWAVICSSAECLFWSGDWILHSTSRWSFGSPGRYVGCAAWKISSASCLEPLPSSFSSNTSSFPLKISSWRFINESRLYYPWVSSGWIAVKMLLVAFQIFLCLSTPSDNLSALR